METAITILRELWRDRVTIALCAAVAIVAGGLVAYRPSLPPSLETRQYEVGIASARILLDTPASQVVAVAPESGENLGGHANLLANLMGDGEVKAAIAKRAGLDPDRLLTVTPSAAESNTVSPTKLRDPRAYILKIRTLTNDTGEQLPIIDVDAQAADARQAAVLANAAVSGLREYLDDEATGAGVAKNRRLQVRTLGAAQGRYVARGPSGLIALGISIVVFITLCALVLGFAALGRGWQAASVAERTPRVEDSDAWAWEEPSSFEDDEPVGGEAEVGAQSS